MATTTDRAKMRRPQKGVAGDPNDTVQVALDWNTSMDVIDLGMGMPSVTSSSHTVTPYDGQMEYETDTDMISVWDDALNKWVLFPGDRQSRGRIAENTLQASTASQATAAGEQGPHYTLAFTAMVGRRYTVEVFGYVESTAGTMPNHNTVRVRVNNSATPPTTASAQLDGDYIVNNVRGLLKPQYFHTTYTWVPNVNGTVTIGVFLEVTSGGDSAHFKAGNAASGYMHWIGVKDVGI